MKKNAELTSKTSAVPAVELDTLCQNAIQLIQYARRTAARQINTVQLMTFYAIGRWIIEGQQHGERRAEYGRQIIKNLSDVLTERFGKGFSVDTLENARKFYLNYQDRISDTVFRKFAEEKSDAAFRFLEEEPPFRLSFSHYLILCRIRNNDERRFYEIEAYKGKWSVRTLQRQYGSSLYERLLLGAERKNILALAEKGQNVENADDLKKDPYVLEFLGLQDKPEYAESELESRIIGHLQKFLMEMGKGFTFVGRQVRFSFDEDHFRVDLVLYNRLLKCFVLIDLKVGKLKHQDIGQMQMYVNYYDRYEKTDDENPTVGILLCSDKNDSMVEMTLPKDANIYASRYELYLPDKEVLQKKLKEWLKEETGGEER